MHVICDWMPWSTTGDDESVSWLPFALLLQLHAYTGGLLLSRADVKLEVRSSPLADVKELARRERWCTMNIKS